MIVLGLFFIAIIVAWHLWKAVIAFFFGSTHELYRLAEVLNKRSSLAGSEGDLHTEYYVSFSFLDGQKPEEEDYLVPGRDFNLLDKGDVVNVRFEGKNYASFSRQIDANRK